MYSINYTHQFKKDMRKCAKRGLNVDAITVAISIHRCKYSEYQL